MSRAYLLDLHSEKGAGVQSNTTIVALYSSSCHFYRNISHLKDEKISICLSIKKNQN